MFSISMHNKESAILKLEKLNKKAIQLGNEPLYLVWGEEFLAKITDDNGCVHKVPYIEVDIKGDAPVLNGWMFVASIDHSETFPIVMTPPSIKNIPMKYTESKADCDHCNHKRKRNKTFVVFNIETNEYKEVGSTCIKDFTGHDPKKVISFYNAIQSMELFFDGDQCNSGIHYVESVETVLNASVADVSLRGRYFKVDDVNNMSTSDVVRIHLNAVKSEDKLEITDEHKETTKQLIEYFKELDVSSNMYLSNIKSIILNGYVGFSHIGLLASSITVFNKHLESKKEQKSFENSEFVGVLAKRMTLENVEVLSVFHSEGFYGITAITKMVCDGNVLTWFNTGNTVLEVGDILTLAGTPKDHSVYKEIKQTVLQRCKVKSNNNVLGQDEWGNDIRVGDTSGVE